MSMSTLRIAAKQHTRTLSQPLRRRTFYTPYAALQHSPLTNPTATATTGSATVVETAPAAQEHEHEHAARTVYVVAEPNAADFQFYGVPAGAYPVATPYTAENANMNVSFFFSRASVSALLICAQNSTGIRRRGPVPCCAPVCFLTPAPEEEMWGKRGAWW